MGASTGESGRPPEPMSVADFAAWLEREQPEGRYELYAGEVYAMAAERLAHVLAKRELYWQLERAIRAGRSACQYVPDGAAIAIADGFWFQPDAMVICEPLPKDNPLFLRSASVIVEIGSPSTSRLDVLFKTPHYFELPALMHYLCIGARDRRSLHFTRNAPSGPEVASVRILGGGVVDLPPTGLSLDLDAIYDAAASTA